MNEIYDTSCVIENFQDEKTLDEALKIFTYTWLRAVASHVEKCDKCTPKSILTRYLKNSDEKEGLGPDIVLSAFRYKKLAKRRGQKLDSMLVKSVLMRCTDIRVVVKFEHWLSYKDIAYNVFRYTRVDQSTTSLVHIRNTKVGDTVKFMHHYYLANGYKEKEMMDDIMSKSSKEITRMVQAIQVHIS